MLLAYEQIQDNEDGAIGSSQVTLPQSERLRQAMHDIDDYSLRTCGSHIAQTLPAPEVSER